MRKASFLTVFILVSGLCTAQKAELDSLLRILHQHTAEDSVKLNLLLDIAFDYSSVSPGKGVETASHAIELAQKLSNPNKLATAYNYMGVCYDTKGDYASALMYYNKSLDIRRQLHDSLRMAKILHNTGIVYFNLADYPKSLDFHLQSLEIFQHFQYNPGIAGALNSIGVVYLSLTDYPKALEYYFRALRLFEQQGDKQNTANAFTNIGLVYNHSADYTWALEYHSRALAIFDQLGDRQGMRRVLGNMGNTYADAGNPGKALECYWRSLNIADSMDSKAGIASNLANMGAVYNESGNYTKALECLQKALKGYTALGDKSNLAATLIQIGKACREAPDSLLTRLGVQPVSRYNEASSRFHQALQAARATGALDLQDQAWEELSRTYVLQKDYNKALEAYKQHIGLRDSVMNGKKRQEITKKEMQFEFDKKEAIMKAEEEKRQGIAAADLRRQRTVKNMVTAGAVIVLLATMTILIFYKRRRDAEDQKMEAEFKAQVADTEMKALRLQMNPHFIFNSLNSISDYISKHDLQTADYYLTRFAKLMRLTLEHSEQKEVRLSDDLKALELYMQLESLRLNNKFTYEIKVDESIDPDNTLVPPLMLQPFVENSIWHGLSKKTGPGKILIEIRQEEKMLNCIVEDDGIGKVGPAPGEIATEKKSFGVRITKARIDILNKVKKSNAGVELSERTEGIRVEVKLPIEQSF